MNVSDVARFQELCAASQVSQPALHWNFSRTFNTSSSCKNLTPARFTYWHVPCTPTEIQEKTLASLFPVSHCLPSEMILVIPVYMEVAHVHTSPAFLSRQIFQIHFGYYSALRYNHTFISFHSCCICSFGMPRRTVKRAPPTIASWQRSRNGIKRILNYNRSI